MNIKPEIKNKIMNPLLEKFNTKYTSAPFSDIKKEHYLPAFQELIKISEKEIDEITNNSAEPTFANTIEAMAFSGEGEQTVTSIVPMEKISSNMHFIKPMEDHATSDLLFASEGAGTKVTWSLDYEVETVYKPLKPLMTWEMNKSFSEGLGKLKELSEK